MDLEARAITATHRCSVAACPSEAAEEERGLPLCATHATSARDGKALQLAPANGPLEPEERRRVVAAMAARGWSHREIAERVGAARSTVQKIIAEPAPAEENGAEKIVIVTATGASEIASPMGDIPSEEQAREPGTFETRARALVDAGRELDHALERWRQSVRELTAKPTC